MMRFDYYSATVPAQSDVIIGTALNAYDLSSYRICKPVNGYENGGEVFRGEDVLARVFWGGFNGDDESHVLASGIRSPDLAAFLRGHFPEHRVSRADVCIDFCHEGAWPFLLDPALSIIKARRMKSSTVGDWITPGAPAGRTLYMGSRTSDAYMRLYEKGKQLGTDPNHVRAELVCQPHKRPQKERLATTKPEECWGAAVWAREYLASITGKEIAPLPRTPEEPSDDDRALHHLIKQYGGLFQRLSDKVGGFALLGVLLEHLIELQAQEPQRIVPVSADTSQLCFDFYAPRPDPLQLLLMQEQGKAPQGAPEGGAQVPEGSSTMPHGEQSLTLCA